MEDQADVPSSLGVLAEQDLESPVLSGKNYSGQNNLLSPQDTPAKESHRRRQRQRKPKENQNSNNTAKAQKERRRRKRKDKEESKDSASLSFPVSFDPFYQDVSLDKALQHAQLCKHIHPFLVETYRHASKQQRADKEITLAAVFHNGGNLQYASDGLQNDKEVVMVACYQNELHNDKEVVLTACNQNGLALKYSSKHLQDDKEIVMEACSSNGLALEYASEKLRNDIEVVMVACTQDGRALKFASQLLQDHKEVVLKACSQWGSALQYASNRFQREKEIVMVACSQNGWALQFASEALRGDKVVVMAAAESNPESLKFALAGLNQDKDCLIKANLWDKDYAKKDIRTQTRWKKIVLSTKFSLAAESSPHATRFTVELKKHPRIAAGDFIVYSPNAFSKGTCDPNWTDKKWPCRGTYDSCRKPSHLKTGIPQEYECCWRYSFRHYLKEASCWGGFMIQVVDRREKHKKWWQLKHRNDLYTEHKLGDGQSIETEMAQQVGTKIFRYFEPPASCPYVDQVNKLVSEIDEWYADGCSDTSDCNIFVPN